MSVDLNGASPIAYVEVTFARHPHGLTLTIDLTIGEVVGERCRCSDSLKPSSWELGILRDAVAALEVSDVA